MKRTKLTQITPKQFAARLLAVRLAARRNSLPSQPDSTIPVEHTGHAHTTRQLDPIKEARHQENIRRNHFQEVQSKGFSVSDNVYFRDASDIPSIFGLMGSAKKNWRKTDRLVGQIHGLPSMRGTIIATNGVLCAILSADSKRYLLGHIQHFVPNAPDDMDELIISGQTKQKRKNRLEKTLADYC